MDLVTLEEAKRHLRIYDDSMDDQISQLISSTSEDILDYITDDVRQPQRDSQTGKVILNTDGTIAYTDTINPQIKGACLIYIELIFNQLDFDIIDNLPATVYMVCRKHKKLTILSNAQ